MRCAECPVFAAVVTWAWWCSATVLFLVCTPGCRQHANTVSVTGTVTFRGEALTNAAIMFFPDNGPPVTAVVSSTGRYSAPLPPGDYTVVVNLGAQLPPGHKEGDPIPPPRIILPPQYSTRAKSTLHATVETGRKQVIDFPLE